jgi:hypothetical protein
MTEAQRDQYSQDEIEQRVKRALKGAFKTSPTKLKAARGKPKAIRASAAIRKALEGT